MKKRGRGLIVSAGLLFAFVLWTLLVCVADRQAIGPRGSVVGLATVNGFVRDFVGVNMTLYNVTDWLGLVPIGFVLGFGMLGLVQWIKRKSIKNVDYSLIILGGFYVIVVILYLLFEELAVNFRPVLINGVLEASYPSSTTLLVLCVMPTAFVELKARINNIFIRRTVCTAITVFIVFMITGRVIAGVHWITDIVGGILLSAGLVSIYCQVCRILENKR